MPGESSPAPATVGPSMVKKPNAALLAIRALLADIGITTVIGAAIGAFMGAARFTPEEITNSPFLVIVGLLVSVYIGYVLYQRYSEEQSALIILLAIAAVWGGLGIYISAAYTEGFALQKHLLFLLAQLISYSVGWYGAKMTAIKLFIPKEGWLIAASVIGGIMVLVNTLGIVWLVSA